MVVVVVVVAVAVGAVVVFGVVRASGNCSGSGGVVVGLSLLSLSPAWTPVVDVVTHVVGVVWAIAIVTVVVIQG